MKINKGFVIAAVALVVQIAAIGWLVWRYERIVLNGTEVRLRCQAYDPYDPLRGRYLSMTVWEDCTNILFDASEQSEYDHCFLVSRQVGRIRRCDGHTRSAPTRQTGCSCSLPAPSCLGSVREADRTDRTPGT